MALGSMWDDFPSGQDRQSEAVTDVSREMYGVTGDVQARGGVKLSKGGLPTNSSVSPEDKDIMNKGVIIVVAAAVLLVLSGTVVFKGHTL